MKFKVICTVFAILLILCSFNMAFLNEHKASGNELDIENSSFGNTYYVAKTGSDFNQGTESQPLRSIQNTLEIVEPGDTVNILGGTYHEKLVIDRSGTPDKPITIKSYGDERAVFDGSSLPDGESVISVSASNVNIVGLDASGGANGVEVQGPASNVIIDDVTAYNNHHGINFAGYSGFITNSKIINCETYNNNEHGILVYWHCTDITVDNNYCHDNCFGPDQGSNIHVCVWAEDGQEGPERVYITNNVCSYGCQGINTWNADYIYIADNYCAHNDWTGIQIETGCDYIIVEDNICEFNSRQDNFETGIWVDQTSHCLVRNNIMRKNVIGCYISGSQNVIVRNNYIFDNDIRSDLPWGTGENQDDGGGIRGLLLEGAEKTEGEDTYNVMAVHNTIHENGHENSALGIVTIGGWCYDNHPIYDSIYKNNILSQSNGIDLWIKYSNAADLDYNTYYTTSGLEVAWLESSMPFSQYKSASGQDSHSITSNPKFANPGSDNFNLQSSSPCIDSGDFLTKTTSSGSGKTIHVQDARYFMDGYGIADGDLVKIGSNNPIRITDVNYNTNTLTVDTSITWGNNNGVSYPYDGSSPDMGAYESESSGNNKDLTITIDGEGSTNPSEGTHSYPTGTTVSITATSNSGWHFDHWEGDLSGDDPTKSINMNSNKYVKAVFEEDNPDDFTLTTSTQGSGSVSPSGGTYPEGTTVTITANPSTGWSFSNWIGDVENIYAQTTTITMDKDQHVTAVFSNGGQNNPPDEPDDPSPANNEVLVLPSFDDADVNNNGVVDETDAYLVANVVIGGYDPGSLDCDIDNDGELDYIDYTLIKWYISNLIYMGFEIEVNDQDIDILDVEFYLDGVNIGSDEDVNSGDIALFVYNGLEVGQSYYWNVKVSDGEFSVSSNDFYFTIDEGNNYHTLTTNTQGSGSVNPSGGSYPDGTEVTITANPSTDWSFDYWIGDVEDTYAQTTTIIMDTDQHVTAKFTEDNPDEQLDQTNVNPGNQIMHICDGEIGAQSFIPSLPVLTKIELMLRKTGSPSDMKCSIRDSLVGSDLTSFYIPSSSVPTGSSDWVEIDLPDIDVATGLTYYIVLTSSPDHTWNNDIRWNVGTDPGYPSGSVWGFGYSNDPNNWQDFYMDNCFKTYGKGGSNTFTLTTDTQGSGSVNPSGGSYPDGTEVTITANPSTDWSFDYWIGDVEDVYAQTTTIIMDTDQHVTAKFTEDNPDDYTLTTSTQGSGTVNPSGGSYSDGTEVTITANPSNGWSFDRWIGDVDDQYSESTFVVMDKHQSVTAVFNEDGPTYHTLSVNIQGSGSVSPPGGTYVKDTVVTLTATPDAGYMFDQWENDASGSDSQITITMNSDKTVTAVFIEQQHGISLEFESFNVQEMNVDVKNHEQYYFSNVQWSIKITGGILGRVNLSSTGVIDSLDAGATVAIVSDEFPLGLGLVSIIVEVETAGDIYKEEKEGIILGTFVIII